MPVDPMNPYERQHPYQGQYGPAYVQPAPSLRPPERGRSRKKTAAALASVALVAGLAGGTAGVLVDGGRSTPVATASSGTTAQVASDRADSSVVSAVAKAVSPSVVEIRVRTMQGEDIGAGVILSADGQILTNNHVVADAANGGGAITVAFNNGKTATASIVGTDPNSDLALIKAQNVSGLTPATLGDSSTVKVGDEVIAIGSPEGLQGTVTSGVVSYLGRKVTVPRASASSPSGFPWDMNQSTGTVTYKAIQTDASLNPGNSGGPLLNTAGEVIGINSAIYSPTAATGSAGSVGLGFSIPINQVKKILPKLEQGGAG